MAKSRNAVSAAEQHNSSIGSRDLVLIREFLEPKQLQSPRKELPHHCPQIMSSVVTFTTPFRTRIKIKQFREFHLVLALERGSFGAGEKASGKAGTKIRMSKSGSLTVTCDFRQQCLRVRRARSASGFCSF